MSKIRTALISVYDKDKLVEFAKFLKKNDVKIISTGGTGRALSAEGIEYTEVSDLTGFPEVFDGRVKTLQPQIHGGILARRGNKNDQQEMKDNKIEPIDMVVVNLYPFEKVIAKDTVTLTDAIENIDIGGPAMIRAAAKNFRDVLVVIHPDQYDDVTKHMEKNSGGTDAEFRFEMAKEAFARTAEYDAHITNFLSGLQDTTEEIEKSAEFSFPSILKLSGERIASLRYGENPHQKAAIYKDLGYNGNTISDAKPLQGKALSFNNILDFESAWRIAWEFDKPSAIIIKHNNPCGAAVNDDLLAAYTNARATDPVSAFGSVIGFNRELDEKTAKEVTSAFIEGVVAPSYSEGALALLGKKKNVRVLELGSPEYAPGDMDIKKIIGGLLAQTVDDKLFNESDLKCVTERKPTDDEMTALRFGWVMVKYIKSNAIVYAKADRTIGVGAGQMSRVDSAKIGIRKAKEAGLDVKGTIIASDAFFPFRDSIDAAAAAGVTAIIQPRGSIRDQEVIDAANEHKIAMLFTGMRHFRH